MIAAGVSTSTATAIAAESHPWHDAIAEVRVIPDESRLEVSMRVDGPHLEAMVADWSGERVDLDRATGGSADELRLAAYVRRSMEARFVPSAGPEAASTPANDRFDFHWFGRELEGTDCWLHFQWVAPPAEADAAEGRPVQVRSTLLIEPHMQQVNTVSVLEHAAVIFAADRTDWAEVNLVLAPRQPRPLQVARAGDAGPRVLLVPAPAGPGAFERRLAARLRDTARVEIAFWPGADGGAPPPSVAPAAHATSWIRWAARCLDASIAAAGTAGDSLVVVLTHPSAERLLTAGDANRPGLRGIIRVAPPAPETETPLPEHGFDASVIRRYRAEATTDEDDRPVRPDRVPRELATVAAAAMDATRAP